MRSIEELLSHLRSQDIRVWVEGDRLRYSAPHETLTDALRDELVGRRAEILDFLQRTGAAASSTEAIRPIPRTEELPLSSAQQRMWFLNQLEAESSAYNVARNLHLSGPLNVPALVQSLTAIVNRHEILRTTFTSADGKLVQEIGSPEAIPLPIIDLRQMSAVEQTDEVRRLAREEAARLFDLSRGPLIRATLLRLGDVSHVMLVTMHHIVTDGWSLRVFTEELAQLYEAFAKGSTSPLPELPIQYADYAHWQRQWLQGETLEAHLAYWLRQLGGELPVLNLPTDYPRPVMQTYEGARHRLSLFPAIVGAVRALSLEENATPFMILLAAFKALLHRYTGQEDIVVGTPVAGRSRPETEPLIGLFINTLVLRTRLDGNPTFRELVERVRQTALGAYAHQDLPFERLVEVLNPVRDLSRPPLFQVMFNLRNLPCPAVEISDLTIDVFEFDKGTAQFDLSLEIDEEGQELACSFVYNTDLFAADSIERMAGHFQALLEGATAHPDSRISELPLLTEAERHLLLVEWNDTQADYPADLCVHHLVEKQVEHTPHAVAVEFGDQNLSYAELNARANQLAHALRRREVGPEVLVGVLVDRSLTFIEAVLGVLKAGGACVPLDPSYPRERLAYMLRDTQAPLVLAQERLLPQLLEYAGKILCLDRDRDLFEEEETTNPGVSVEPDHLAYVFYTSGSTGNPNGVLLTHRGIVNQFAYVDKTYGVSSDDSVLQVSSLSFDESIRDTGYPLTTGARVVVTGPAEAKDPAALLASIVANRVTCLLSITPTMLRALTRAALDRGVVIDSVRLILPGGEPLQLTDCRDVQSVFGDGARIVNQYGPTETTMITTYYPVTLPYRGQGTVPIGKPIPNSQVYILDNHLNPVPIGVQGELHVGGVALSRGYLNQPDLTSQKFIPHPFNDESGARLYKTGDLARHHSDGTIEFLGRRDHQVKVRGFRIEPGEIEAVLESHAAVQEAVVVVREDQSGDRRLAAYIIPPQGQMPSVKELRNFLRLRLPEYMIPSAFALLETLPMTPTGKVDRRALPEPDTSVSDLGEILVAPRTHVEEMLVAMWAEVLEVDEVGIHNDFFDLGGHSLMAVRLVTRIEQVFGRELPLATFFEAPTISQMAGILEKQDWAASWSSLVPLQPQGDGPPLFIVHPAGGQVIIYYHLIRHMGTARPVYGLQAQGLDGRAPPHTRVEDMAAHYLQEIRRILPDGPYHLCGFSFGGMIAYEMARQLAQQGEQAASLIMVDTGYPSRLRPKPADVPKCSPAASGAARRLVTLVRQSLARDWEKLRELPGRERLAHLRRRLRYHLRWQVVERLRSRAGQRNPAAAAHWEPAKRVLWACRIANQAYTPQPYGGHITYIRAAQNERPNAYKFWESLAGGGMDIISLEGDHRAIVEGDQVSSLARAILAITDSDTAPSWD